MLLFLGNDVLIGADLEYLSEQLHAGRYSGGDFLQEPPSLSSS